MADGGFAAAGQGQAGGWKAPEHRQCVHLHESGQRCRATTKSGGKFCHTHQRWADTDPMYPVKVPLLEDPDSIRLVMTQAVRAMAMGTVPAANGRGMLYGCRMALDLLLFEFAREKFAAKDRAQTDQVTGDRLPGTERGAATDAAEAENLHPSESGSDGAPGVEGEAEGREAEEAEPEPAGESCALEGRSLGARFPDLREQWEKSVTRAANEVSRNLGRKDGEALGASQARQRGPMEAGHPEARSSRGGDPGAETREGPCGPKELPFDPSCPPPWNNERMKDWLPEHMAAWFRALVPGAPEKEVRYFMRTIWDIPEATARAGWPRPAAGQGRQAPPEGSVFWTMNEEEMAAWLRREVPDVTEREVQNFAERGVEVMEEARKARGEMVAV
jgi:hypothetical protein